MSIRWCNNEDVKYPKQLLQNRDVMEGNVIASIWKDIDIIEGHIELKPESFITFEGRLLFTLAKKMYDDGYKILDEISVYTYLQDKDKLREYFDDIGGFATIKELTSLISKENIEKFIDELNKWNVLIGLHDRGFDVLKELDSKFKFMKSNQIYDYFDLLLQDLFIKRNVDTEISDFKVGIDEFIDECDKGMDMGYSYATSAPRLNYLTSGVMDGFHIVAGLSGTGKTTFCINTYILPLIEGGHNIILLCNEQTKKEWYNMVLATILSTKFNYYFNRKRFLQGHFTPEEREMLKKAIKWLKEQEGKICFVKMFNYNLEEVKMILKKYSKLNFKVALYDTMKADTSDGSNNPLWQTLLHSSKEIFQTCSKEGIRIICTIQIAQRFANTRFLNNSCLSGATSIIEVASTCILLRPMWDDEADPSSKFCIKPYNHVKGEDGRYLKTKQYIEMNLDKKGIVLFVSKNRAGDSDVELYWEQEAHVNKWTERAYCSVNRSQY